MRQTHLFVMDPVEKLNMKLDSSIRLAYQLKALGHEAYLTEINSLFWKKSDNSGSCVAQQMTFDDHPATLKLAEKKQLKLEEMTAVHMRKDPPFDMNYIAATWLLDSVKKKVHLFNDPEALRSINEKMTVFDFEKDAKNALVASDPEILMRFIEHDCNGDAIVKPLDLFGGRGVFRLNLNEHQKDEAFNILIEATGDGKALRLIQAFDENISKGEIRTFSVGGKALSWCLKKPSEGSYLANTAAGASLHSYSPTKEELTRVERCAEALMKKGVFFIGFDIIGGYISEANITSPRLLTAPDDQKNYYLDWARWTSEHCQKTP